MKLSTLAASFATALMLGSAFAQAPSAPAMATGETRQTARVEPGRPSAARDVAKAEHRKGHRAGNGAKIHRAKAGKRGGKHIHKAHGKKHGKAMKRHANR